MLNLRVAFSCFKISRDLFSSDELLCVGKTPEISAPSITLVTISIPKALEVRLKKGNNCCADGKFW